MFLGQIETPAYIQAHIPYESPEVSSNQPDGVGKSSVLADLLGLFVLVLDYNTLIRILGVLGKRA